MIRRKKILLHSLMIITKSNTNMHFWWTRCRDYQMSDHDNKLSSSTTWRLTRLVSVKKGKVRARSTILLAINTTIHPIRNCFQLNWLCSHLATSLTCLLAISLILGCTFLANCWCTTGTFIPPISWAGGPSLGGPCFGLGAISQVSSLSGLTHKPSPHFSLHPSRGATTNWGLSRRARLYDCGASAGACSAPS